MTNQVLTSDNPQLSRVTKGVAVAPLTERIAVNCTSQMECSDETLPEAVTSLLRHSLSDSTRRAYRGDLDHFQAWGGIVAIRRKSRRPLYRGPRRTAGRCNHHSAGFDIIQGT